MRRGDRLILIAFVVLAGLFKLAHDELHDQLLIDQSTTSTVTRASVRLCEPPPDPDQLLPKPDDLHPFHERQGGEA
jgi:hypothetical protein